MIAGMRAVAAPIRDGSGRVVGGLAIGASAARLSRGRMAVAGAAVMAAAARLSGIAGDQMRHAVP